MKRSALAIAVLFVCTSLSAAQLCLSVDGTFDGASCRHVEMARYFDIEPSDTARRFLVISDAAQDFAIGSVPPKSSRVDQEVGRGAIQLEVSGIQTRGWPLPTRIELSRPDQGHWAWSVTAEQIAQPVVIRLAAGKWDLILTADGHEVLHRDGIEVRESLGKQHARLTPLLRVTGRAVDPAGEAVHFPAILGDCRHKTCEGRHDGWFVCDFPRATQSVCVDDAIHARKRFFFHRGATDVDIGVVTLTEGGELVVTPAIDQAFPEGSTVSLLRSDESQRWRVIGVEDLRGDSGVTFHNIDAGAYGVLVKGPEPLQRKFHELNVSAAAEQELTIGIEPYKLTGIVRYGEAPLADARIAFQESAWRSELSADRDGRFAAQLWSPDEFAIVVSSSRLPEPFWTMMRAADTDSDWSIDIPNRSIRGNVRDAGTEAPIAGAAIRVEWTGSEVHYSKNAITDARGAYEIGGARDGDYEIGVNAEGYILPEPKRFRLSATDRTKDANFLLERGTAIELDVISSSGNPLVDALVIDELTPDGSRARSILRTDARGSATVRVPAGSAKRVYVVPASGSFATAIVTARSASKPVSVVVPAAAGSLRIQAQNDRGVPLPGLRPMLRFNGEPLPDAVIRLSAELQGFAASSDAAGRAVVPNLPSGRYDLALGMPERDQAAEWTPVVLTSGDLSVVLRYHTD